MRSGRRRATWREWHGAGSRCSPARMRQSPCPPIQPPTALVATTRQSPRTSPDSSSATASFANWWPIPMRGIWRARCAARTIRGSSRRRSRRRACSRGRTISAAWLGIARPASADCARRAGARRQPPRAGHGAVRGPLRRPPVRQLGRPARRRPRDHARRAPGARRASLGTAAQGRGARRPIRATPTGARCCARRCANSSAARRCTRSACRPRAR